MIDEAQIQRGVIAYKSMESAIAGVAEAKAAAAVAAANEAAISAQSPIINAALLARAQQSVEKVGVENVLTLLREQQALADQAVKDMLAAGISSADELALRTTDIVGELTSVFDEIDARASAVTIDVGNFTAVGEAAAALNFSLVDALPGIASVREEIISLGEEMAFSGVLTDEQAARLEYLSSVAYAVSDSTSDLGEVTRELGGAFLESNDHAAALISKMYETEAAYLSGLITADVYAGIMNALGGDLLLLASNANVATGAILRLNAAQGGASAGAQAIGGSIAASIQSRQDEANREHNRREAERVAKEEARQAKQIAQYNDRAAQSAAKQTESSARRAGQELEKGAKKAAQELVNSLKSVPGLFNPSEVTEADMKLGDAYEDNADEKLRRLRDEVWNGVDWADVSIEQAADAIRAIGLEVAGTKEGILAQFEQLWSNQALWSNKDNIANWINEDAVQQRLSLQEKMAEGERNLFEYFGVKIDDLVESATSGASASGGGASIPPLELDPIEPANFIDVDPFVEGVQTGLDEAGASIKEAVQKSLATVKGAFFSGADWFGAAEAASTKAAKATGPFGPMTKQEFLIKADPTAAQLANLLTTTGESPVINLVPTFDAAAIQLELDKLELTAEVKARFGEATAHTLALDLGNQLSKEAAIFLAHGASIGGNIKTGIAASMNVTKEGASQVDIAGFVGGNLGAQVDTFIAQGGSVGDFLKQGIAESFAADSETNALTSLIQNINTQVRASTESFKREGTGIGNIVMAGFAASFAGTTADGGASMAMVDPFLSQLNAQFSANQNMFYASGTLPASNVLSGFANYDFAGIDKGVLDGLTNGIRENAANYTQRGATIGNYVQRGLNDSFSSEFGLSLAIVAGEAWSNAFRKGAIGGLSGLVSDISAKVLEDIAGEVEQPN